MAEGRDDEEELQKSLAHLKQRALDVKFDLDTSEYVPQENIGIGAYGVVCSAIHKKTNDRVAIKKIPSVFDVKDVAKRTYREIKILKHFKHDNIIHIREILKPKCSMNDFKDVYVVFDLMESDLHRIIYSKQELTEEHVRYFLYQILRGLKYIHSAHVVHRDLKPSNLLVNEDCQLRIGDFGMSRGVSSSPQEPNYFMTQYVATRWYRAPEIMLSLVEYGTAVDMWSVGCIFAEMLGRKPLFPGKDYISQIRLIVGVVGSPKEDLLQLCHSPIIKNYFKELGHKAPVPWTKLFPTASKKAINLLSRMLVLHPKERLTVEQALVHPYLNKYHDPDDEPICVPAFNFDFEKEDKSIPQIREAIYQEAMEYHQPRTPTLSFNAFLRPVPKSETDKPPESGIKREATLPDSTDKEKTTEQTDQGSTQNDPVQKPDSGEVFKKPLSAKNDDPMQVRIDTSQLKVESHDIEMLSAKSTDGKVEEKPKENQEPGRGHKQLISQDTKALVKAALMNANLRKQRLDSVGDDEKPKGVTAAQRQREREEKRKKKERKSAERRRKDKLKKAKENEELLTNQDKELLMRWAKMQTVNVPIAPKPEIAVDGKPETIMVPGQKIPTGNILIRPGASINIEKPVNMVNPNNGQISGVQGQSSSVVIEGQSQGQSCKNVTQKTTFGRTVHKGPAAQQNTISLLQQHLRSQGQGHGQNSDVNRGDGQSDISGTSEIYRQNLSQNCSQNKNTEVVMNEINSKHQLLEGPISSSSGSNFSVDFSTVNLGDLDFLTMISTPKTVTEMNYSVTDTSCNYTSVTSVENSHTLPKIEVAGEESTNSDFPSAGFLQKLCSEGINVTSFPQNLESQNLSQPVRQSVSPSHSSSNMSHISPNSQSTGPQFFSNSSPQNLSPSHPGNEGNKQGQEIGRHSPEMGRNASPHHISPEISRNVSPHNVQQDIGRNVSPNHIYPQEGNVQGISASMPSLSVNPPFSQTMTSASFQTFQFPANSCVNTTNSHPQMGMTSDLNTNNAYQQQRLHQTSQMNVDNSIPFANYMHPGTMKPDHNTGANTVPGLFVNTKQAQMPYRRMFQDQMPGPSGTSNHGGNPLQGPNIDLIALAKQLSKSNMDDLCPPLALTPKGTGGGYGVGLDVDSLMVTSQDGEGPMPEPSPLSSSILADWMEVTGNMNIDMDALEQELQSPMAFSYNDLNNDLNLYSS